MANKDFSMPEPPKMLYKVPFYYERYGYIEVSAIDYADAKELAEEKLKKMNLSEMDKVSDYLPDSECIDPEGEPLPGLSKIMFEEGSYPFRYLKLSNNCRTSVSVESLQDKLLKEGEYVNCDAKEIDEQIAYYVPDDKISLPSDELLDYIKENIDEEVDG